MEVNPTSLKEIDSLYFVSEGKFFRLKGEGYPSFLDALNLAFQDSNVNEALNFDSLKRKFESILSRTFLKDRRRWRETLKNELTNLVNWAKVNLSEWNVILPLDNLKLMATPCLNIDPIRIFKFDNNTLNKLRKTISNPKSFNSIKSKFLKPLLGVTCGKVVLSATEENLTEKAVSLATNAINILRLYSYPNDDFYTRYLGVKGDISPKIKRQILAYETSTGQFYPSAEWVGPLYEFEIDNQRLKFMRDNGFQFISKLLKNKKNTEFDEKLLTAINWFGTARSVILQVKRGIVGERPSITNEPRNVRRMNLGMRIMSYFATLECLFTFGRERGVSNKVPMRVSKVMTRKKKDRSKLKKYMKTLYTLRSEIIHSGFDAISEESEKRLFRYTQQSIFRVIKLRKRLKFTLLDDFRKWLDNPRT